MNAPSTLELVLRMVLSLAIMGAVGWLVLRLSKARHGRAVLRAVKGARRSEAIEIRGRRQLSRSASLALVRVGDRTLLLGVGDTGVQILADGDDLAPVAEGDGWADHPDALVQQVEAPGERTARVVPGRAWTHAPRASSPGPARMGVVDALRELTVRR